ncbi:hypothetical protein B296_00003472 [Ensete ventricosum]|uniref:Uncharacterized protein n=1 Tax=Ensete ventricosum TaxID=4639 RepID=A0A427BBT4_ENSVE|nr:hypothetical protein B296_00003472 [Ensete ventricosum]
MGAPLGPTNSFAAEDARARAVPCGTSNRSPRRIQTPYAPSPDPRESYIFRASRSLREGDCHVTCEWVFTSLASFLVPLG